MTAIIAFMARLGVMPRFQKAAAWFFIASAVVGVVILIGAGVHWYVNAERKEAVKLDRAEAEAEVGNRIIAADRAADAAWRARDEQARNEQQELRDEARKGDEGAVGPGTSAVYARLRMQQAERARKAGSAAN